MKKQPKFVLLIIKNIFFRNLWFLVFSGSATFILIYYVYFWVEEGDLLNTTWESKVISLFINLYCPNFIIVQSIGRFSLWQQFASNLSLILETLAHTFCWNFNIPVN